MLGWYKVQQFLVMEAVLRAARRSGLGVLHVGDEELTESEASTVSGSSTRPQAGEADDAWSAFLAEQAPLILQVVHLFERDADQVQDCFLFVCERLRRDGLRRIRKFREKGPASFATWLRAVVRHLCLDWRRHRDGRFRLPSAVARLPELDREVFRSVHLRGLTENETFHSLREEVFAESRGRREEALREEESSRAAERPASTRQRPRLN